MSAADPCAANHLRTHTKEKPLKCDICHKRFSESSNLAKHRKTYHHNAGLLRCRKCGDTFHRRYALNMHEAACNPGRHASTVDSAGWQTPLTSQNPDLEEASSCLDPVCDGGDICTDAHCSETACFTEECSQLPLTGAVCSDLECFYAEPGQAHLGGGVVHDAECRGMRCDEARCSDNACIDPQCMELGFGGFGNGENM
jgi:hypothetical protein